MILDICTSDQNIGVSAFARVVVVILPLTPHLAVVFVQASIQACASAARSSASWPTAGALFFHSSIHFCASAAFASASLAAGAGGAAFFAAGAETRDPYPAGEYNARLKQRAETGVVEDELVEGKELEVVIA